MPSHAPSQGNDSSHGYIQLSTGKMFNPLNPDPAAISIEQIAHAGAMMCRYAGNSRFFYSVNEHAIQAKRMVEQWGGTLQEQLATLLHDSDEALGLPDLARPVKVQMPGYKAVGEKLQQVVFEKFGLPWPMPPITHIADNSILFLYERPCLMGHINDEYWQYDGELRTVPYIEIAGLEPIQCKRLFLKEFNDLYSRINASATPTPVVSGWGKET